MQDQNWTEGWKALQQLWQTPAPGSDAMRQTTCSFWENQSRILAQMQKFTDGWYERRQTGIEAALKAGQRICEAESPIDAIREYQDWAVGAISRVTADNLALQQEFLAIAALIQPQAPDALLEEKAPASPTAVQTRPRAV